MKKFLALGCVSACALLVACSDDGASSIDSDQIRPPADTAAQVPPPGDGVKLGSNKSAPPPAAAKPKTE